MSTRCFESDCITNAKHPNVRYVCAYPFREEKIEIIKKWNENIKKILQIDEFTLEGIVHWQVYRFKMIPNVSELECGKSNQKFRDEAAKLIAVGFDLGFNEEYGVGDILIEEKVNEIGEKIIRGFIIELWQDSVETRIYKETLDEVLDWIIYFHCIGDKKAIKNKRR